MVMLDQTREAWPYWLDLCPDRWDLWLQSQAGQCPGRGNLTKEEFLKFFPMFADAPEEWIDMLLTQAQMFDPRVWGRWLKWGQALFVAHFLSMREMHLLPGEEEGEGNGGGIAGFTSSVVSFKAGSVSYTKDTSIEAKLIGDPMMQTIFGQQLLDLIRSRIARGLVMVT